MWLSRSIRHPQRALAIALGIALLSIPMVSLLRDPTSTNAVSDRVVEFEPIAARADAAATVSPLEAAMPAPAEPEQGEQPAPEAPPSPEPVSPAPTPPQPVVAPAPEPAFEQLAVVDPLTNAEVTPVAFSDLPAGEVTVPATEADVPLYVPGSIGKAKRQWAGGGDGSGEKAGGLRTIVIGSGGGHCPVPGRVIPPLKTDIPNREPRRR